MNILLHICCGPCSIFPLHSLRTAGHNVTGFFYNHNIHPYQEYVRRLNAVQEMAEHENLELIIQKALQEENPDKKNGLANAVAYYMKLAYANWHKETVHDDAIQGELSAITNGQLEFTNTPFVRSFRPVDNRERSGNGYGDYRNKRNQKFQRNNNNNNRNNDRGNNKFKKKRY